MAGTDKKTAKGRRDFLKLMGLGAAAAAAGASGPKASAEAAAPAPKAAGYRETEHVRKAYQAARF